MNFLKKILGFREPFEDFTEEEYHKMCVFASTNGKFAELDNWINNKGNWRQRNIRHSGYVENPPSWITYEALGKSRPKPPPPPPRKTSINRLF